jgi:CheY-like chemotaxis protein
MSSTDSTAPVLVVDDDRDIRAALRDTLELEGYAVAEARDGGDALKWLQNNPLPRLILLDWNMAPMNGPQFMEALEKNPLPTPVPVVLLTADARVSEKSKTARYAGYLKKPVELDPLFAVLKQHCG